MRRLSVIGSSAWQRPVHGQDSQSIAHPGDHPIRSRRTRGVKGLSALEQRRLAAIVAADVVGYSRLMGRDEVGTVAHLRSVRAERLQPVLDRCGGGSLT